jgi:hypothetical protein
MVDEPEKEAQRNADDETGDDGKVEGGVVAAMDDVARKAAKTEGEFAAEKEKCANEEQDSSEDEQGSAKLAVVHAAIMQRRRCGGGGRIVPRWIRRRW